MHVKHVVLIVYHLHARRLSRNRSVRSSLCEWWVVGGGCVFVGGGGVGGGVGGCVRAYVWLCVCTCVCVCVCLIGVCVVVCGGDDSVVRV